MRLIKILVVLFVIGNHAAAQGVTASCTPDSNARKEVIRDGTPYRYICHVIVHRTFTSDPSTAFLVSPNLLLTAGHSAGEWRKIGTNKIRSIDILLFDHYENGTVRTRIDSIHYSRRQLKFGAHPAFCGNGCPEEDFGFIKLPTDTLFKLTGGYFVITNYDSLTYKPDSIFITGYPGDKQEKKDGSLWNKGDHFSNVYQSAHMLAYGIFTWPGDSGAPVWFEKGGKYYVIGIHNRGPEQPMFRGCNGARKLNKDAIALIETWQNQ